MKRLLVLFALLFILTVSPSAESGAVTLEPVRITVTTSTPNTTPGATLTIDLLNSNGSDLSPAVQISRTEIKTNLGGVLSFVLDEPDWSAPVYDADYLVRVTYGGVVLSIERLEVVYAKQGLFGPYVESDDMDPEGTVTPNHGGTGLSSYTKGDIIYASDVTTLSNLNDAATGNALISGGVGTAPSWGKIDLTSHTEGILPVAKGGTGQNSYTDGQLLIGNTTGNTLSTATLTAGPGIAITNGNGSITIASVFVPENFVNRETFTTDGTFTIPAGVYKITIEAVGGSGGGGGSGADMTSGTSSTTGATGGGGAGGAGEYAGMFLDITAGDVISVTIGSAGTLGTAGSMATSPGNGGAGGNGGQTIVKKNLTTVITAYGGSGGGGSVGNSSSSVGSAGGALGAGGTGSTAQKHINGTAGEAGTASSSTTSYGARGSGVKGLSATGVLTSNQGGMGGNGVVNTSSTGKKDGIAGSIGVAGHVVITYYQE